MISGSLAPEEQAILSVKYRLPRISETSAIDIPRHAKGLLFRLHTITGWKLPEDDLFLNTLVSEFTQYLVEKCGDLNPEEISYAFRHYALDVQDWGKSMNISLIDKPLQEYRERRRQVSIFEEARKNAVKDAEFKALPAGECDWSDQWEKIKEEAKIGTIDSMIILTPVFDWLERTGKIKLPREEKISLMKECREALIRETQFRISEGHRDHDFLKQIERIDWMCVPEVKSKVSNLAKLLAVKRLAVNETK